ncbi:MAG TPA: hypothetical protein PK825_03895 [Bacteroidales bacterium]|nr:hypothetical protein [Bacteroidales bacterium]
MDAEIELTQELSGVNTDGLISDCEFERRVYFEQEMMDFEVEQLTAEV